MKKLAFLTIIILCAAFFASFTISDDLYVSDMGLRQIYESTILAITLAVIGVTASMYYGDTTTSDTIKELRRIESKFEQKIENLESKFDQINDNMNDN